MNKEIKKRITIISEVARQRLAISRDEYALCSYIQYRSSDPRQKLAGWCCDNKDEVADFIGVTRPGLYKMVRRMEFFGLLESGFSGAMRVTAKWIDSEQECKQSLQNDRAMRSEDVNKVYKKRKQSLHDNVNKVYESIIIKVKGDNKEEKEEVKATTAGGENYFSLNAEKENPISPVAPAPLPAAGRVDIVAEVERLKTDHTARENFTLTRKIPADRFERYVADFSREVSSTTETYWKVADFRRHFFNWCEKHYRIEQDRTPPPQPQKPTLPRDMVNLNAL